MTTRDTVTAELFVRSLAPRGAGPRLEVTLEELSALSSADAIDGYDVHVWGESVPTQGAIAESEPVAELRSTLERLEGWAEEAGADLLGFDERTVGSLVEENREVLSLPEMLLVEYRDGDVDCVTPHRREGVVHTVNDRLGDLRAPEGYAASGPMLTGSTSD